MQTLIYGLTATMTTENIAENIRLLRERVNKACLDAGRQPEELSVMAVSKTRSATEIAAAVAMGLTHIGENYLQEALEKQQQLREQTICWHFIGPIQSNKTRAIAEHFDWVHSVDRLKIIQRLAEQRPASLPPLNICLQVNISAEASKAGASPEELPELAKAVLAQPRLHLRGLMAIPEASGQRQVQAAACARLRVLLQQLRSELSAPALDTLSMGMSGDLEAAVAEGSTLLRIGTDIFGPRR